MREGNKRGYVVVFKGKVVSWHQRLQYARKSARPWKADVCPLPDEGETFHIGDAVTLHDDGTITRA